MNKVQKWLLGALVLLVGIQFIQPGKNVSASESIKSISTVHTVPEDVKQILVISCNDCHSNNTIYPWYSNIQPVGWWLAHHVDEGKEELNFDEFATYSLRKQYHKLEETEELVNDGEMPLKSYTWTHKNAILNETQKQTILNWSKSIRSEMLEKYPLDSLVRR
ncbi:MAG: heme-binding domain-containing protein [Chitinophagales bacterium]|nr:heme-binding domain-containing protein [Chitinophagales bacterium]